MDSVYSAVKYRPKGNGEAMTEKEILSHVDHTLLGVAATWDEIRDVVDDGIRFETASVCIPPRFVQAAAAHAAGRVKICTVIGFPNGYNTTAAKVFETKDAVENGADEIDMVIPVGAVKAGAYAAVEAEIRAVKDACGEKALKVIVETCLLADGEKRRLCAVVLDYLLLAAGDKEIIRGVYPGLGKIHPSAGESPGKGVYEHPDAFPVGVYAAARYHYHLVAAAGMEKEHAASGLRAGNC